MCPKLNRSYKFESVQYFNMNNRFKNKHNIFHVAADVILIVENVIQSKNGMTISINIIVKI